MTVNLGLKVVFLLLFLLLFLFLWIEIRNTHSIQTTTYTIAHPKIDQAFVIVQLSDFHTEKFEPAQKPLLQKITREKPDIIVLTGDVINSRDVNTQIAYDLIKELVTIAPTYYVPGNHEARLFSIETIHQHYKSLGCHVLRNESIRLTPHIQLSGIDDPSFIRRSTNQLPENIILNSLEKLQLTNDPFHILLSHRPEHFHIYQQFPVHLALTGHAHGGQIILPLIGPIYAPNQGFFPSYARGQFSQNETTMIISRGLGNSSFPLRIHNRPELVVVHLLPSK